MAGALPTLFQRDYLTREGALAIVRRLDAYWAMAGFNDVSAWVHPSGNNRGQVFSVRSNLDHRGLPASASPRDLQRLRLAVAMGARRHA